jgi:hypothetical protein
LVPLYTPLFFGWTISFKVFKKCSYDPKTFFLEKIKKISKNPEFHADFKSVEKVVKNAPKKLKSA